MFPGKIPRRVPKKAPVRRPLVTEASATETSTTETGTHALDLVLLTGMSGAGRSTAARALEDLGWFVIDNMPPSLLRGAIDLAHRSTDVYKVAVVLDARGGSFFATVSMSIEALTAAGELLRIVYLEASDESLVRRFESSRRPHPLQRGERIVDGLVREREILGPIRNEADVVIDTTNLNVHELRRKIETLFASPVTESLRVVVMSFGFKYGIPIDADMVADVRFLPNPYWDEALRPLNGQDDAVSRDVLERPGASDFLDHYEALVEVVREGYLREGKRFVTIAIGCTGGKHRSVAMVEALTARLRANSVDAVALHRDLGRE
jgi:RNase adapter protein RapZ